MVVAGEGGEGDWRLERGAGGYEMHGNGDLDE